MTMVVDVIFFLVTLQIFGSLCSCPLKISEGFYGTGESFLYKFDENDVKVVTCHFTRNCL